MSLTPMTFVGASKGPGIELDRIESSFLFFAILLAAAATHESLRVSYALQCLGSLIIFIAL